MAVVESDTTAMEIGGRRLAILDRARIYACGITPYDVTHLGHAATFIWVDVLARTLGFLGASPELCRNVTDVDDVLHAAARAKGTNYDSFAAIAQFQFERDMQALGVRSPHHAPRAHRYVNQVIRLAAGLLDAGVAYVSCGSVYFPGRQVAVSAGLAAPAAVALLADNGGRPDDPAKNDPMDMAVWQAHEPDQPFWESPWGPGRPGWHAECAAMAMSIFGPAFDVHAGGADLRFPHHAYHAAMTEALTGVRPYARASMHVGIVRTNGAKMAKSAGNLVLIEDLLAEYPAAAIRLMIVDRRWAADWDYDPAIFDRVNNRLDDIRRAATRPGSDSLAAAGELRRLLANDLAVPSAIDLAIETGGQTAQAVTAVTGLA